MSARIFGVLGNASLGAGRWPIRGGATAGACSEMRAAIGRGAR
eukprot:CAMPEP_0168453118 /NCGR_PEP_ID=MMETSP0228-20121227/49518_1 /TAXON_ID=133427 /ORGANISM="Protoceratium reticulatum, Strain CCCM 535 (=CCMP 1889)" /LENGTH=42 /DNA_ID= /DNA_START= /DNA_END= /DNA_ORIENTATION=